jgi:DNA polymerase
MPAERSASSPRRAAAEQLASLKSAGVTHLLRQKSTTQAPQPESRNQPNAPQGARAQREAALCALAARVAQCTRCSELASTRTQTVFGVGNPQARIMFLGEAPGADEDRQGEPFVGMAGQLLNKIIEACRMKREDVYICNILRCRPPNNRPPEPEEAANCREYLDGQIAIVDPEYIVCWGGIAAKNLLGAQDSIGKLRGRWFQYGRAKVLCTYHPAYLLRTPSAKKEVWADMKILLRDMGVDLDASA